MRPDIEAAIDRMGRTLGIRRELQNLESKLDAGETVHELGRVDRDGHGCLLAVTNSRLIFLHEGMVRNQFEELPIRAITSVGSRRRLTNGQLLVTVAGNAEVWSMTSATHCNRMSESIRTLIRQYDTQEPTAPPVVAPPSDLVDQIRKLGEMRDAGVLSEEEFATAKAKLLS